MNGNMAEPRSRDVVHANRHEINLSCPSESRLDSSKPRIRRWFSDISSPNPFAEAASIQSKPCETNAETTAGGIWSPAIRETASQASRLILFWQLV
jgi:hypothetical protein